MTYLEEKATIIDEIKPDKKEPRVKKRLEWILKIGGILLSTILIPIILSAYQDTTNNWVHNLFNKKEPTKKVSATSNQGNLHSDEAILIKLNQLANSGKIIKCDFALGTQIQDITQKWGQPDSVDHVGVIEYWNYKKQHIVFGVYKDQLIDIRSFDPILQKLTLKQILESGKPNKEYNHTSLDQHFLVYNIGNYKLRLIFPKPTEDVPSPHMINISLVDTNYAS